MATSQVASKLFKVAKMSLLYPFIGIVIGMVASSPVFPGCKIDSGAGARGCKILELDIGGLLEIISFGGMFGFMIALFIISPFCFIVGTVIENRHQKSNN